MSLIGDNGWEVAVFSRQARGQEGGKLAVAALGFKARP